MAVTLGNVGKASSGEFAGKRKLLLIPYVAAVREDQELKELVAAYWAEAAEQVRKLEASFGEVRHLFHEGSVGGGDEAVNVLEEGNPAGFPHLRQMLDRGASLEPTEDVEVLRETLDLHRCMLVVQASQQVRDRLVEWLEEARTRRYSAIAERVGERIGDNGVAVLVISPDHRVQFPSDVEVVYVAPPSLDRISRWMREHPPGEAASPDAPSTGEEEADAGEGSSEDPKCDA